MLIDISKYGYMNEKCSFDLTEFDSNFEFRISNKIQYRSDGYETRQYYLNYTDNISILI